MQYDLNHDNSIVVTRDESGVFSVVYKLRQAVSVGRSGREIASYFVGDVHRSPAYRLRS